MSDTSTIDYGFDATGGFVAIDHAARRVEYAYPTSYHADRAKRNPATAARAMLSTPLLESSRVIQDERYPKMVKEFAARQRLA